MKTLGLALLAALLWSLSHPSSPPLITKTDNVVLNTVWQALLAWFGLIPLLYGLKPLRGWKFIGAAYFFGVAYFGISQYWINIAIIIYGGIPIYFSLAIWVPLILFLSAQWTIMFFFAYLAHRKLGLRLSVTLPVFFVGWELIRNYLFSGYPWHNMAYSQYLNLPILQTASIWGIYGILFLLILSNTVLFELLEWRRNRENLVYPKWPVVALISLVAFSTVFGVWRMHANDAEEAAAPKLKAAMVQGNIDQHKKSQSYAYARKILDVYKELTLQVPDEYELVIWPEAAFPYNVRYDMPGLAHVFRRNWPETTPWKLFIGVPTYLYKGGHRRYYNSAYLLDNEMSVIGRFQKSHLVPAGEYVPLREELGLQEFQGVAGAFYPGELGPGLRYDNRYFGAMICYEGIFPEISRHYAEEGVEFLVNLTNDAWYGASPAPYQHLVFYTFRAVETGKAILRAANTGFTAMIDTSGRVRQKTKLFERTVLFTEIPLLTKRTLYSLIGDSLAWLCFFLMAYWTFRAFRVVRKQA